MEGLPDLPPKQDTPKWIFGSAGGEPAPAHQDHVKMRGLH